MKINRPRFWALTFLALTTITAAQAEVAEPQNLLIQNVRIINSGGEAVADVANLRVRDGLLDLVTKDQIAADDGEQELDAGGGYLLGTLAVGAPPTFMILDEDPVADVMILLDTPSHVVFAIDGGEVLVNQLVDAVPEPPTTDGDEKNVD